MEIKNIDDFIKAVLNDRAIFYYDEGRGEELFDRKEMASLKGLFEDKERFREFLTRKIEEIRKEIGKGGEERFIKNRNGCLDLASSILKATERMPLLLRNTLSLFDDLGLFKSNLPKGLLEDVGSLIETTDRQIIEQFILSKKKRNYYEERAINLFLEYLKVLYSLNLSLPEKGFVVRKLNILINLKEVFKL